MCIELSCAPVTRLNFIKNQQAAVLVAKLTESVDEFDSRLEYTCNTLDSFDYYGSEISFRQLCCNSLKVVQRSKNYVFCRIERCLYLRVVGSSYGSGCPAVECLAECQYLCLSCVE